MDAANLPDTQNSPDLRNIIVDKVGIKDILHPLRFIDRSGEGQSGVAKFTMTVTLPAHVKGTHMSRFVEVLNDNPCEFGVHNFDELMVKIRDKLQASRVNVRLAFPFFRKKSAPSSKVESLLDYQATLYGELNGDDAKIVLKVVVPVTSLCPCSKSISEYGAHNQRSHITIKAEIAENRTLTFEDLIDLAERKASCELYGILKRDDEKVVTERAYENPAFVEDLVRDIALELNQDPRIDYYRLESENFESIHNHSAYALIEKHK